MAHWNRIVAAGLAFIALGASVSAVDLQQVLFVGNNWEGTASILQSTYPFASLGKVNVVPDKAERIAAINANPIAWIYYQIIQGQVGEGHDQLVDDLYATPDGTALVASRPSFADVVSIDLKTGKVNWRFAVAGNRADHMAVSPDGLRVAVSASTANTVHVLDINTGKELGNFKTGDNVSFFWAIGDAFVDVNSLTRRHSFFSLKPHENFFTNGATLIWNMAIGHVETALDDPIWDWTKGDRHITIADANTFEIVKTINMRDRLTAFGLGTNYSNAIRPAAFLPDYSKLYFQVSFFNGFFEYDVAADKLLRKATLPTDLNLTPDRSKWLLDSRHHGITMHPTGTKVCVAGTMDSYATIVDLATLSPKNLVPATKPYWATISGDGKHCVVSEAGANITSFIDFETGVKVAQTQVGYHPQRVRLARIPVDWKSLL